MNILKWGLGIGDWGLGDAIYQRCGGYQDDEWEENQGGFQLVALSDSMQGCQSLNYIKILKLNLTKYILIKINN